MRRLSSIACCCSPRGMPNNSSGSRILSTTLRHGNRFGSWKTNAVRGAPDDLHSAGRGLRQMRNQIAGSSSCHSPDGPTIETNSPPRTEKSTDSSTGG